MPDDQGCAAPLFPGAGQPGPIAGEGIVLASNLGQAYEFLKVQNQWEKDGQDPHDLGEGCNALVETLYQLSPLPTAVEIADKIADRHATLFARPDLAEFYRMVVDNLPEKSQAQVVAKGEYSQWMQTSPPMDSRTFELRPLHAPLKRGEVVQVVTGRLGAPNPVHTRLSDDAAARLTDNITNAYYGLRDGVVKADGSASETTAADILATISKSLDRLGQVLIDHGVDSRQFRSARDEELARIKAKYDAEPRHGTRKVSWEHPADDLAAVDDPAEPPPVDDDPHGPQEHPAGPVPVAGGQGEVAVASTRALKAGPAHAFPDHDELLAALRRLRARFLPTTPIPPHPGVGLPTASWSTDLGEIEKRDGDACPTGDQLYNAVWAATKAVTPGKGFRFDLPGPDAAGHDPSTDALAVTLTRGWWRRGGLAHRPGDVLQVEHPGSADGTLYAVALSTPGAADGAGRVLLSLPDHTDCGYVVRPLPPGAVLIQSWSPAPVVPFAAEHPFGRFYGPTLTRIRALCVAALGSDVTAGVGNVTAVLTEHTPWSTDDPVELVARIGRELRPVSAATPLWPGTVVFGPRKTDLGVLLTDGTVLGENQNIATGCRLHSLTRFAPIMCWYPTP